MKALACLIGMVAAAGWAWGQPGPDYGHDFVTVGAAGNRAALPHEVPDTWYPDNPPGAVGHEFRITRTEVLVSQWYDYVTAYAPFYDGALNSTRFTSWYIVPDGGGFAYNPAEAGCPVTATWEHAARYCNWLHNNRVNAAWAFESGAYDTSTFTRNGSAFNHQREASPGARYRLPTYNESIKAFYFDPNRYGEGQEGYWLYPQSSDEMPVSGAPDAGGTTNTGY